MKTIQMCNNRGMHKWSMFYSQNIVSYGNRNGHITAKHINVDESCKRERSQAHHNAYHIIPSKQKQTRQNYYIRQNSGEQPILWKKQSTVIGHGQNTTYSFRFLWVVVIYVCSLGGNVLGCALKICALSTCMLYSTKSLRTGEYF